MALLKTLRMFRDKRSAATLSVLMNAEQMEQLQEQFIRFIEQQKSALPKFWLSYMDMVSLLLRFVRASQEGNWLIIWCVLVKSFHCCSAMTGPTTAAVYLYTGVRCIACNVLTLLCMSS